MEKQKETPGGFFKTPQKPSHLIKSDPLPMRTLCEAFPRPEKEAGK